MTFKGSGRRRGRKQAQVEELRRYFGAKWRELAGQGVCDEGGGHEFNRVWLLWQREDYPFPLDEFIRERANTIC